MKTIVVSAVECRLRAQLPDLGGERPPLRGYYQSFFVRASSAEEAEALVKAYIDGEAASVVTPGKVVEQSFYSLPLSVLLRLALMRGPGIVKRSGRIFFPEAME